MKKGQLFTPHKGLVYGYITPLLTIILLIVLTSLSVFSLIYKSQENTAALIDNDLQVLVDAFNRIDQDCKILNFDYTLNRINFLNVESFVGSEVGAMHLGHPEHWKGPYLKVNPTVQEQEYFVVVTHQGCFVTPGFGVRLPNGRIVGSDIVLNKDADIETMMQPGGLFYYNGKALAAKLKVGATVFERILREHAIRLDDE
jgi:hypothetical protein